jgi:chromosome segregation ATPase
MERLVPVLYRHAPSRGRAAEATAAERRVVSDRLEIDALLARLNAMEQRQRSTSDFVKVLANEVDRLKQRLDQHERDLDRADDTMTNLDAVLQDMKRKAP